MTPVKFPECNTEFGPPPGFEESQIQAIPAHVGQTVGGSCDGCEFSVVAYQLSAEELTVLLNGGPIYLTMLGGLAPHYLSTDFNTATHPA